MEDRQLASGGRFKIEMKLFDFLLDVKMESKRVNWPTRDKTIKDTIVVIAFAVAVAAFLSTFDFFFQLFLDTFIL